MINKRNNVIETKQDKILNELNEKYDPNGESNLDLYLKYPELIKHFNVMFTFNPNCEKAIYDLHDLFKKLL